MIVRITDIYTNKLKNRFLTASAWQQILSLHSRLVSRQWSFAPDTKFAPPPCQIPDFSVCLCIDAAIGQKNVQSRVYPSSGGNPALKGRVFSK